MRTVYLWCFLAGFAATTKADTAVIDQSYESYGGYGSVSTEWRHAQTFVVGLTGKLTRVEVALRPGEIRDLTSTAEARLEIAPTSSHVPLALPDDILASSIAGFPNSNFERISHLEPSFVHQFFWVPFEFGPIDVTIGDELAIVLTPLVPHGYQWAKDFQGTYPDGDGFSGPATDLSHPRNWDRFDGLFRTYVVPVPEPSSLVMGPLIFIGFARLVRNKVQPTA